MEDKLLIEVINIVLMLPPPQTEFHLTSFFYGGWMLLIDGYLKSFACMIQTICTVRYCYMCVRSCSMFQFNQVNWPFCAEKKFSVKKIQPCSNCTHTFRTSPISQPIRKTREDTNVPVTLIHSLRVHMWSDGAVDRCRGKERFEKACQVRVGSTSMAGGLTRALAHGQRCLHSWHHYTHTQSVTSAIGLNSLTTTTVFYMADL